VESSRRFVLGQRVISSVSAKPTAIVYVDGFNLYRQSLAGKRGVKWLDLHLLIERILPDYDVLKIEYFTANLKPNSVDDPHSVNRQQLYLRALSTCPKIQIHFGTFRADTRYMLSHPRTLNPETGTFNRVRVIKIEEKGSDVNLATRMVAASLTDQAEVVVLLSNDSDHAGQVAMLTNEYGREVGLISPYLENRRSAKNLRTQNLLFARVISEEDLLACQFPWNLKDSIGDFFMPPNWA
jgi:uncharacterized LabA/DUF88 family protein